MLTDGFYAEVTLGYDAVIAEKMADGRFPIEALRPIQLFKSEALEVLAKGQRNFHHGTVAHFSSDPSGLNRELTDRAKLVVLLRMMPFVERNYNMVELGPRGTGKEPPCSNNFSPYSHLISGGKATVAKMFVNNANGQRGLVCHYDVVCFDEVSDVVRPEGRCEHPQGLHGVGRVLTRREHPPKVAW